MSFREARTSVTAFSPLLLVSARPPMNSGGNPFWASLSCGSGVSRKYSDTHLVTRPHSVSVSGIPHLPGHP